MNYTCFDTNIIWMWSIIFNNMRTSGHEINFHITGSCCGNPPITDVFLLRGAWALSYPASWSCRKPFSQWKRSFQRKLRSHWLKFLRQHHVTVARQDRAVLRVFEFYLLLVWTSFWTKVKLPVICDVMLLLWHNINVVRSYLKILKKNVSKYEFTCVWSVDWTT